ncbi:rod shape-determining protein [Leptotrichia sp. OH3620_COT-345]|uniref:rod shape-determining protein n=1 Tax=Leptotrichia sp. OH3620_COT-345 TaxID=2491048 RepID=UPI000F648062|nr:rod shape-determining protein [Leptotrichia sp. OH3620_COT-345]RRD39793.1 rod shape-determining protein [Leptotrichia sp. OH3620_COT-345]
MSKFTRFINFFRTKKNIAIDLGTSNILIYDKQKKKIVLNEPSVLVKDKKTGEIVAIGHKAKEMLGKTSDNLAVIRPLSEGVISDIDATREMLNIFVKQIYGGSPFRPEIMICVPAEVTSIERRAIFDAAIGAKKIYLIEEGRAAVLGSGINISLPEGNTVIDIGGGSTDIAILSLDEIIASKSVRIASNNFDDDIVKYVKKKFNLLIGDKTAENLKKEIGTAMPVSGEENLTVAIKGRDLSTGIPKTVEINSNQVREAIEDSINEIIIALKEVLEKCPPELSADILNNGIVLTGGGSLLRNFDKLIEERVQITINRATNSLESVVVGGGLAFDNKKLLRTLEMREI